jgi:hypothetical protein
MAENTSTASAGGGDQGPHASCFIPTIYLLSHCFPLTLVVLAESMYTFRCLFYFLSPFQKPSGYRSLPCTQVHLAGALTSCLVLTGLSMEAELLPGLATTQGGSAIYHFKPQVPSISCLLVEPDTYRLLWLCSHPAD